MEQRLPLVSRYFDHSGPLELFEGFMCFRRKCSLSRSFLYSFRLFIVSRLPLTFSSLSVGPGVVPISRFFLNFSSSLLRMSLSFFILFFIPTSTCRCWIEFLSVSLPSPSPSPTEDRSLLRRSLKRGSRLWKAGECFSLTLMMTVLLFLRMASSLGRTRGKLRLQCPGPTEWGEEWSGRARSCLDLKTEEGWLRREGLWCFEKSRRASLIEFIICNSYHKNVPVPSLRLPLVQLLQGRLLRAGLQRLLLLGLVLPPRGAAGLQVRGRFLLLWP